jgi:hypothetical protein
LPQGSGAFRCRRLPCAGHDLFVGRPVNRERLVNVAVGVWLVIGSFIYLRQFVAQGMWFLKKLLAH